MGKFKVIVVLLVVVTAVQKINALNEDIKYALDCGDETNFDIKQIQLLAKRKFENVDNDFKCFMKCMLGKLDIYKDKTFKEEGYLNTYKNAKPSVARKIFKGCKEDVETEVANSKEPLTECETAFVFFKCSMEFRSVLNENRHQWAPRMMQVN